ncbi:hypothetical protein [Microbacterium sp. Bi128]|uniref:hypothetical protein n=1 Tax=Microbacterium sp. Bi128 TaxID=2821115 RepID=UPI001E50C23D|nr:hypothetical protein [Microbacterium sp. Bi128]
MHREQADFRRIALFSRRALFSASSRAHRSRVQGTSTREVEWMPLRFAAAGM